MIYICIPAHNEEQTVGVVLWKVRQVMAELGRDYQLLVTDDGSTDRTPAVLEPYTRVLPLTVYRTDARRGYAAALEMLLREAVRRSEYPRRDAVIVLQADFTEDPQHVETLIKRIESGADIVASNTVFAGVRPPRSYRWGRAALNRMLRRFAWPEEVRDPVAGLNAYRIATVKRALDERQGARLLRHEGWAANAELLKDCAPHARRVDVVELEQRRERLQRPERFHFMTAFRQVLALVRGRAFTTVGTDQLQADAVYGGRSLRTLVAESLRDSVAGNGVPAESNGRLRGTRGRGPAGEGRTGGGKRPPRRTSSERPAEGQARAAKRRKGAASNAPQASDAAAEAQAPKRRKSRKRKRPSSGGVEPMAQQPVDAGTSETGDGAAAAPSPKSSAGEAPSAGPEGGQSRRRRRGSRGGRRRKRGASSDGSTNTNDTSGSAPDASAPEQPS